jgi:NAD(P)-dependent dehydrogenase (short-subunit alcohol dehydrogenase family)
MIAQGRGGRIVGASSQGGKHGAPYIVCSPALADFPMIHLGRPNFSAYAATKFAVRGLTQSAGKSV